MQEPSILDYVKSKLIPWKYPRVDIEPATLEGRGEILVSPTSDVLPLENQAPPGAQASSKINGWPWRSLSGLLLALTAQTVLQSNPSRTFNGVAIAGCILLILSALVTGWAAWRGEWRAANPPPGQLSPDNYRVRGIALLSGLTLALAAFLTATNNHFTLLNLGLLLLAIASLVVAFWQPRPSDGHTSDRQPRSKSLTWALLVTTVLIIAAGFRFAQLADVPGEMNSDHAEKILDIIRLLAGQTQIFFPNNGGREALQFYLVAGYVKLAGIRLDFMALKSITALVGFLTLPFYYLLGKEIANRRVGLLAMAFAGVAYWPNVVSRLGLRLPFSFLFTAATLYLLLRSLRFGRRNDFIWLGLAVGLSLYGYSANRVLPMIVILGIALYLLHTRLPGVRQQILWFSLMALVFAGVVFLPMFHYILDEPGAFFYRMITRLGGAEQPLAAPVILTFLRNTGRALAMFSWSNGEVWTASVPYRPALEVASGALFWTGVIVVFVAYLRKRNWLHLFLLLSIPVLMLPSILVLAFPNENPNLYRTGGAAIPVFLLAALALEGIMAGLEKAAKAISSQSGRLSDANPGAGIAWALALILFFSSAYQGSELVFKQYRQEYALAAWNTSEMGELVRTFAGTYGQVDNVYIMGYPHWVDTRLVGITSGFPLHDFALFAQDVSKLPDSPEAKLFIINPQDQQALDALQEQFSRGVLSSYPAKTPGKEFLIFFVPALAG